MDQQTDDVQSTREDSGEPVDPRSGSRGGGGSRFRLILLWIGIPLVIVTALEVGARVINERSPARLQWYEGAVDQLAAGGVDFLFLGTSRTASGILPEVWESEIEKATAREAVCLNLGRAFAGPVANYFGLRELMRRYPEEMRRCTVFIEMSAGLPALSAGWDEHWFYEGNTQLIVDYMNRGDLLRFLSVRTHSFEDKAGVVARYLGRRSVLIATRRRLQQAVEWHGMQFVRWILERLGTKTASRGEVDLPQNRQLRQDAGGVRLQRELVQERLLPEALAAQRPLRALGIARDL